MRTDQEYKSLLLQYRNPDLPRELADEAVRSDLFPPPEPEANPDRDL